MKSRFFKYIISIGIITLIALLYVHQQVELVKLSYAIDYKEKTLKDMLDHKEGLEYNINNLEAPSRLENVLIAQKVDMTYPKRAQIVKVANVSSNVKNTYSRSVGIERKVGRFWIFEFLGLRAEAQAREK